MTLAAFLPRRFTRGNCMDACLGTVLVNAGAPEPGDWLFAPIDFAWDRKAPIERAVRFAVPDHHAQVARRLGFEIRGLRGGDFARLLDEVLVLLDAGQLVAVAVDHFAYPASAWFQRVHRSHTILLIDRQRGDNFAFVDPFARYDRHGIVDRTTLAAWCDVPALGPEHLTGWWVDGECAVGNADEALASSWNAAVAGNVSRLLLPQAEPDVVTGLAGIVALADSLRGAGTAAMPPVEGIANVGLSRSEHGRWLRRAAVVSGRETLAVAGERFDRIGRQWDMVAAVAQRARDATGRAADFARRKATELPSVLESLASAEARTLHQIGEID